MSRRPCRAAGVMCAALTVAWAAGARAQSCPAGAAKSESGMTYHCVGGAWQMDSMTGAPAPKQGPTSVVNPEGGGQPQTSALPQPGAAPVQRAVDRSLVKSEMLAGQNSKLGRDLWAVSLPPEAVAKIARGGGALGGRGGPLGGGGWSVMQPAGTCQSDPSQHCYPTEQLDQIYKAILEATNPDGSKKYDDLAPLADRVLHHPQGSDVTAEDVWPIIKYLNHEQESIDTVERATGKHWEDFAKDPEALQRMVAALPQEQQQLVQRLRDGLHQEMQTLTDTNNKFHPALMGAHDTISEIVMDKAAPPGAPPIHSGADWSAQDPSAPSFAYAADEALRKGDPSQAESLADKALGMDAQNEQALSTLAAAKYDLKDMSGAAAAAGKALELDPNDARAQTVAQLAHATVGAGTTIPSASAHNQFADVPAGLAQAAPWRPLQVGDEKERQAAAAARDAERLLNRGDFSAARDAADRALAADPHSSYAYGLKAFAEIKSSDSEGALRDAVAGLSLNPGDRMAQKARAQALLKLGRYDEGLLAARAAVAGDPRSGYARYLLAEALAASGDAAGARAALKEAASLDLRYADMYKASLQSSELGDMAFLFPDLKPGALKAAGAPAPAGSRASRLAKIAGGAAVGGGLLAWILWSLFGASLAPALKTVFTRRGPATADPSPASSGPALEAPSQKDPSLLRGQYRTLRQIGVGGMGLVYEGSDVSLDRRVAIKKMRDELRLDRRSRERFVSEAKLVAALHHQNIVDIYSIVDEHDELYLIFEYVTGKTLHELVHAKGPMPFAQALSVYRGVAEALEFAHSRGVIHRDLKPSNIMLDDEGRPKVMDFGIARAAKDAMTRYSMTNTVVGTPPYMAPEQEQGLVRKESDVYALAVCLYESLTGALPFSGSGGGMIMNKLNKAFTPASKLNTALPPGLDEVFSKAFEPDPDKRYRSIGELRAALEALPVSAAAA